jgi:hypothetical protein
MNIHQTPITLHTAVSTLAYIHYYTTPFLPTRLMPITQLRHLAQYIGQKNKPFNHIQEHKLLAAHLVLLSAANLLLHDDQFWYCSPCLDDWLSAEPAAQITTFIQAIEQCHWTAAAQEMNLTGVFDDAYATWISQCLSREARRLPNPPSHAKWEAHTPTAWLLHLPPVMPAHTFFHIHQLGHWSPPSLVQITPLTIAAARLHGYALPFIEFILELATETTLADTQQSQLINWYQQAETYRIESALLLTVNRPEQLSAIFQRKNLRRLIERQLSPRHAIVQTAIIPVLTKWLAKQGYALQSPGVNYLTDDLTPTEYHWLGLHLLAELGQLIPLPVPPPFDLLEHSQSTLPPAQQDRLARLSVSIVESLREAIRGRDAFFPAQHPVPAETLDLIRQAVYHETPLLICYQALGEIEPSWREVHPLRLDQYGALYYLHAYCLRAEANRTFRLDRISELKMRNETVAMPHPK